MLEETTGSATIPYTIGDDVIAQHDSTNGTQYLLYDGHGSTRQLANHTLDGSSNVVIFDSYSYDGYGVMLGTDNTSAASADTNLLYAGEQFDPDAQMYYNRARYYNPSNGLFNRVDPFSGNNQDPQSLHKYAYCHNNPVNGIDPSGREYSAVGTLGSLSIGQIVMAAVAFTYVASPGFRDAVEDVVEGEIKRLIAMAATAGMTLKQLMDAIKNLSLTRTKTRKKEVFLHYGFKETAPIFSIKGMGLKAPSWCTKDIYPTGWHAKNYLAMYTGGPRNAVYFVLPKKQDVYYYGGEARGQWDEYPPTEGTWLRGGGRQWYFPSGTSSGTVFGPISINEGSLSDI